VGEVIDQDPKPDTKLAKGSEVQLITEGEVPTVEVPNVTSKPRGEANAQLTNAGFTVVETGTDVTEGLQADNVVSQEPGGGQQAKAGSTVKLVIAVQRVVKVPDVTYKPTNIAQQLLTDRGLKVLMKDPQLAPGGANIAAGNILSQNPAPDTEVPLGATVELVAAAPSTNVPYVVGKKIGEAKFVLQQAGLDLGNVSGTVDEANASTVVINSQAPAYNTVVAKGSRVDVAVPQVCRTPMCYHVSVMTYSQVQRSNLRFVP
jgi:beta-lactam-binding protein with PASTA domain